MPMVRCGILTISDRSFSGSRPDLSGPALIEVIHRQQGWQVRSTAIVPDEGDKICKILVEWADSGDLDVIFTTGGTGFAPRDITPEATAMIIERHAPGIAEVLRFESLKKTPHAMLSRGIAGIRKRTLIINLPGSPKAATENLEIVIPVIPHAVELLTESPSGERGHQFL